MNHQKLSKKIGSQPDTSHSMLGRYKRGEVKPSIEAAQKIAGLEPEERERLLFVINAILWDTKIRKAYAS